MSKKTFALAGALLAALPLAAAADVSKEDLRKLVAAGLSDEVVLAYVKANGPVAKLSADDLIDLKKAGASDKILAAAAAPVATPAPAVQERVIQQQPVVQTTYVQTPAYTSSYYYGGYGGYGYYPYYGYGYGYPSYYSSGYYSSGYCAPRVSGTVYVGHSSHGHSHGASVGIRIRR